MEETFRNPGLSTNLIVENKKGEILLVKRKNDPFKGEWAIPGGFLEYGKEDLKETGIRELEEETHLITDKDSLELINIYSNPKRYPTRHVVTTVYAVLNYSGEDYPGDDAEETRWSLRESLCNLAFDHDEMIEDFYKWKERRAK